MHIGNTHVIEWGIMEYSDITITEGTGLLFQWDGAVPQNVVEMASEASVGEDCMFVGEEQGEALGQVVREWHATDTSGEASVTGLSLGKHYFVCSVGTHCQSGMRFMVTVEPSTGAVGSVGGDDSLLQVTHTCIL